MARILIVDDNLMSRTQLRDVLTDLGHDVVGEAGDGLEASTRVRELRPDLVTLDLVMPGCDGLTALPHLLMIAPLLTVLVCSAVLDQDKVLEALRVGAAGFIAKPISRDAVDGAIRGAISPFAHREDAPQFRWAPRRPPNPQGSVGLRGCRRQPARTR